jgi:hypothetical protein
MTATKRPRRARATWWTVSRKFVVLGLLFTAIAVASMIDVLFGNGWMWETVPISVFWLVGAVVWWGTGRRWLE